MKMEAGKVFVPLDDNDKRSPVVVVVEVAKQLPSSF
jgi:hypothetical protein